MGRMRFRLAHPFSSVLAAVLLVSFLGAQQTPKPSTQSSSSRQAARSQGQASTPDAGFLRDGIYRNQSFGFSYKIPFGWVERTKEMQQDPVDPSKSSVLLAVFERPPEATGNTINSAVVIAIEKVSSFSGLKTAADYFGPVTELATARGFKVVNEAYEFSVGAKPLVRGDFSKERGISTMYQSSLVMLEKGYAVSFTFIGGSEDEVEELIEKLSFGAKKSIGM
jgi:hypothetical protein